MSQALSYSAVFVTSLVLALAGTPLVRAVACRVGAIDHPDPRRVHLSPTPLLGGLAIFGAAVLALSFTHTLERHFLGGLIGGGVILLVGIWDDLYHISPKTKLFGQILAAALLLPFGIAVETIGVSWLDGLLTIFWVVGVTNAFNLIDNMDGLSAGLAVVASLAFFAVASHVGQYLVAATALALGGACLGFLRYNFGRKPARIFMGDTGSLFLGYMLAVLAVRLAYDSPRWITPLVPIAILAVPIFDTSFVTINRIRAHRPIYQGGKDHTSHRLVARLAISQRAGVILLWQIAATLSTAAVFAATRELWAGILLVVLLVLLVGSVMTISRRRHAAAQRALEETMDTAGDRPKRALVVLPTYNERENIAPLMEAILALQAPVEVLVVDDNSPDGTAELVEQLAAKSKRIHLLRRPGKLGLGTAYMAGFSYGLEHGYDCVITMDADFSHNPKHIPALLEAAARDDLVIGSRYIPGGGIENWPAHRRLMSGGANLLTRLVLGLPTHDCTSGYRCYGREALEGTEWRQIRANGYAFLEEMLYRIYRAGFSIGESPIVFADRRAGASKISKSEIWKGMMTLARLGKERLKGSRKSRRGGRSAAVARREQKADETAVER